MASAAEVIGSVKSGPFSMLVSELLCPCMVTGGSDKGWSFSFDGLCWNWGNTTEDVDLMVSLMTEQSFSVSELVLVEAELVRLALMAFVGKVETGELDIFISILWYSRIKRFESHFVSSAYIYSPEHRLTPPLSSWNSDQQRWLIDLACFYQFTHTMPSPSAVICNLQSVTWIKGHDCNLERY